MDEFIWTLDIMIILLFTGTDHRGQHCAWNDTVYCFDPSGNHQISNPHVLHMFNLRHLVANLGGVIVERSSKWFDLLQLNCLISVEISQEKTSKNVVKCTRKPIISVSMKQLNVAHKYFYYILKISSTCLNVSGTGRASSHVSSPVFPHTVWFGIGEDYVNCFSFLLRNVSVLYYLIGLIAVAILDTPK